MSLPKSLPFECRPTQRRGRRRAPRTRLSKLDDTNCREFVSACSALSLTALQNGRIDAGADAQHASYRTYTPND